MNLSKKRWPWISLAALALVIGLGFFAYRALDRAEKEFKESKWVRTTTATVIRKNDGRVYYEIDNFNQVGEPRRSRATQVEKERIRDYGPRSHGADGWYDKVELGAKLYVRYQCFSNGELEIVGRRHKTLNGLAKSNNGLQRTRR